MLRFTRLSNCGRFSLVTIPLSGSHNLRITILVVAQLEKTLCVLPANLGFV